MSSPPRRNRLAEPDLTNPHGWLGCLYAAIFSVHATAAIWFSALAISAPFRGSSPSTATTIGIILPALTAIAMAAMDVEAIRLDQQLTTRDQHHNND
jgi:hypothetical protein